MGEKDQYDLKQLEINIRNQLAQEHHWDAQQKHYETQEKHWQRQRDYWIVTCGIAALGGLIAIFKF